MSARSKKRSRNESRQSAADYSPSSSPPPTTTAGICTKVSDRYEKIGRVGEGTYGIVYKARDTTVTRNNNNGFVALKRCIPHHEASDGFPLTTLREIHALQTLQGHPNIISLQEIAVSSTTGVFLVFDYCPYDLANIIDAYYPKHKKSPFDENQVRQLIYQLTSAIHHVHSHYMLHRDIKLSNLLYSENGTLKLADFGLSRHISRGADNNKQMTANVVSLWYRAPELLFQTCRDYTSAIDLWAIGITLAELLQGCPLWDGKSEEEQCSMICQGLGGPPPDYLLFGNNHTTTAQPQQRDSKSKKKQMMLLMDQFDYLPTEALSFLTNLLRYDPAKRWNAKQALTSMYLKDCASSDGVSRISMPKFPAS